MTWTLYHVALVYILCLISLESAQVLIMFKNIYFVSHSFRSLKKSITKTVGNIVFILPQVKCHVHVNDSAVNFFTIKEYFLYIVVAPVLSYLTTGGSQEPVSFTW